MDYEKREGKGEKPRDGIRVPFYGRKFELLAQSLARILHRAFADVLFARDTRGRREREWSAGRTALITAEERRAKEMTESLKAAGAKE